MLKKILKKLPIIGLLFATGAALKYAFGWRQEWDTVLSNTQNMIEIPPKKLQQAKDGKASIMISYVNGERVVDLIHPDLHLENQPGSEVQ